MTLPSGKEVYSTDGRDVLTRVGSREMEVMKPCIPTDWKRFLRVDGNKSELFSFLAKKVTIEKSNNFS